MPPRNLLALLALAPIAACTTLGPTPATTGISAVPAARTEAEAQVGVVPGYYLSSAAGDEPSGTGLGQLSLLFQPGSLLGVRGLFVGARAVGPDGDVQTEPMLGYRRQVADGIAVLGVLHGAHARGSERRASYRVTRVGAELGADFRLGGKSDVIEPHAFGAASLLAMSAHGTYCIDEDREHAVECPEEPEAPAAQVDADVDGAFPSLTAGVALHALAHRRSVFHGARVILLGSAGLMPRVIGGDQDDAVAFASIGLALSMALGVR